MKKNLLVAFLIGLVSTSFGQTPCVDGMAGIYPCSNVDLLRHMSLTEIGGGANTNDIWGWASPVTGKEYALVGCSNGTAFIDISDPINPTYLGILPGHGGIINLWRDLESRGNYLFIVSEASAHGLQVFDLAQLDVVSNPPLTFSESAYYSSFGHAHALTINQESGFLYATGSDTFSGGLHIVNINDPLNPVIAGGFSQDGYTHDVYVLNYDGPDADHQGQEIAVACNADYVTLVNCTDKTDCQMVSTLTYPEVGYVHQGWFTKDKRYFLLDDELDEQHFHNGTRTHIFDMLDLDNPVYMGFQQWTNESIDHNLYIQDQFVFASNYRSGVRVYDAINAADTTLTEIGFFDLYPDNDLAVYSGTWSNYCFLPSGRNIATSMYDGLFITEPHLVTFSQTEWDICGQNEISFDVTIQAQLQFPLSVSIPQLNGVSISPSLITEPGIYTITVSNLNNIAAGLIDANLTLTTTLNRNYEFPLSFNVLGSSPALAELNLPSNGSFALSGSIINFNWATVPSATTYEFELATDVNFTNVVASQEVSNLSFETSILQGFEGTYFWHVRAISPCGIGEWSSTWTVVVIATSVTDELPSAFTFWPNPVSSELNITSPKSLGNLIVFDLTGRKVMMKTTGNSTKTQLNVSSLPNGVYFLKSASSTFRFVKD
jgi:choice-of-anchor B domain-containing protein